jgi:hypothetical protein
MHRLTSKMNSMKPQCTRTMTFPVHIPVISGSGFSGIILWRMRTARLASFRTHGAFVALASNLFRKWHGMLRRSGWPFKQSISIPCATSRLASGCRVVPDVMSLWVFLVFAGDLI